MRRNPEAFILWQIQAGATVCGHWLPAYENILEAAYARVDTSWFDGGFAQATWSLEAVRNMPAIVPTTDTKSVESLAKAYRAGRYLGHVPSKEALVGAIYPEEGRDLCYLPAEPSGYHIWTIR